MPASDDDDDILGASTAPDTSEHQGEFTGDWTDTIRPVSLRWLSQAFRKDRQTVKKRLAPLQPLRYGRANQPEYDFVQAASYLVEPKIDISAYLKTLQPKHLPPYLQDTFWAGQLKRQQWETRAGHLWPTNDVLAVFGTTFMLLKDTMQLWVENLDEQGILTAEQRTKIRQMVDGLQEDLHAQLVEMPNKRETRSQLAELDAIIDGASAMGDDGDVE